MQQIKKTFLIKVSHSEYVNTCDLEELKALDVEIDKRRKELYRRKLQKERKQQLQNQN